MSIFISKKIAIPPHKFSFSCWNRRRGGGGEPPRARRAFSLRRFAASTHTAYFGGNLIRVEIKGCSIAFLREEGGTRSVTEGECVIRILSDKIHSLAFSLTLLRRELPPGGSLSLHSFSHLCLLAQIRV